MFFRKSNPKGVDFKARLEHKLYLAKEDPDLSFDLSDCDLKVVPKGIYSICKVLRKESLILHHNALSSLSGGGQLEDLCLLTVLDLSSNNFTVLPENINCLKNLKELYLNNNLIKALPESICDIKGLAVLSCPFNRLKKLPSGLSKMRQLEEVYLQGNPALCTLPNDLCLCRKLRNLVLDIGRYTHPPNDIVLQGTKAVLTFLGHEMGMSYSDSEVETDYKENKSSGYSTREKMFQDKFKQLEKVKERKQTEYLAIEKEMAEKTFRELEHHNKFKEGKDRLVEDLKAQQLKIADQVIKFQNKKEADRIKLIKQLKQTEEFTDEIINKMLEIGRFERQPWRIIQLQELDRAAEEMLFHRSFDIDLRKKDILDDMERLLGEESKTIIELEKNRAEFVKDSLSREVEWDSQLSNLLQVKTKDRDSIMESISDDEKIQEVAVAKLLEKNDLESYRLTVQLKIIEKQLAHLTNIELKRKQFDLEQLQFELSSKRTQLSELLVMILNQKDERKSQLLNVLRKMEERRRNENSDYWLEQYQKLLESQIKIDSRLIEQMILLGVPQHLPALTNLDLEHISLEDLKAVGITDEDESYAVYKAVRTYISETTKPSAPECEELPGPSAPIEYETECVVCMNDQCELVFVPCGHLCCCRSCSLPLKQCPLCRGDIIQKVFVIINTV